MSFLHSIEGKILEISEGFLILSLNNISFRIRVSEGISKILRDRVGEKIILYLTEIFEEESITVYGFDKREKRDFFEELLKLSGVGVKLALKIVDNVDLEEWKSSLEEGKWEILEKVPGIGKKLAQRIFFEAKKVLPREEREDFSLIVSALQNLGYSKREIENVIKELSREKERDPEILLKRALERLRK